MCNIKARWEPEVIGTGFITIAKAAKIFGVTPQTLRNWERNGKLKSVRHPMGGYRIYKEQDIVALAEKIKSLWDRN